MMAKPERIAVIDIGKTNVKVVVVDAATLTELGLRKIPNVVLTGSPYPHFDVEAHWAFIKSSLRDLNRQFPFDAISITTHGASAALVHENGTLALPILDYEFTGPDELTAEYDAVRPPFSETFSPRLPIGLNVGAQLFWQQTRFPDVFGAAKYILPVPQYWTMRLTGVAAGEVTSLGCHTDLWNPAQSDHSSMVEKLGWRSKFPPIHSAFDPLGNVLPSVAAEIGLAKPVPVHCGIHDSNASLLPHLMSRTAPFSVVSTGTWVVLFSVGGDLTNLDPARDSLANTNAFGEPVASARFMGGREFEMITAGFPPENEAALDEVLNEKLLLLPSVEQTSGPFPHRKSQWLPLEPRDARRAACASLYLAMMTATSLSLTGAKNDIIIEGPFSQNQTFLQMLHVATARPVIAMTGSTTGTSVGAALLALGKDHLLPKGDEGPVKVSAETRARMLQWQADWQAGAEIQNSA
jgi:sugar (pentulose or hexulose) kinase